MPGWSRSSSTVFVTPAHDGGIPQVRCKEAERLKIMELDAVLPEDSAQVKRYAADLKHAHPELSIECNADYTLAGNDFRFFPAS